MNKAVLATSKLIHTMHLDFTTDAYIQGTPMLYFLRLAERDMTNTYLGR